MGVPGLVFVPKGLSPRMRGNPLKTPREMTLHRSIPAYAGEPHAHQTAARPHRVYPRVCGGTLFPSDDNRRKKGLSPRMRGNQQPYSAPSFRLRSIPAYAGEPFSDCDCFERIGVYPRVCGGTRAVHLEPPYPQGLSPRMRGNLDADCEGNFPNRSIPAYAGEPKRR